jgi:hypothetical protein
MKKIWIWFTGLFKRKEKIVTETVYIEKQPSLIFKRNFIFNSEHEFKNYANRNEEELLDRMKWEAVQDILRMMVKEKMFVHTEENAHPRMGNNTKEYSIKVRVIIPKNRDIHPNIFSSSFISTL